MRVHFLGVRGSTPAPGAEFVRYGGHTSCVALAHDGDSPRLVLDAGTGLRRLTALLEGAPFHGTILLSHLHWDHTHGLPFFAGGDHPSSQVRVLLPDQGEDATEVLARSLGPPHFPIRPDGLQGDWSFAGLQAGRVSVEGFDVLALEIPHKGGRTFGYRVSDGSSSIAYLSDHGPVDEGPGEDGFGALHETACELAEHADLLIHDAQHTAAEFPARAHYGHSAVDYSLNLARACGVGRLVLFHHDPARDDDGVDAMLEHARGRFPDVIAASEDMVVDLAGRPPA